MGSTAPEAAPMRKDLVRLACLPQGQGDGRSLRKVLDADTQGQSSGGGQQLALSLSGQSEGYAYRHSFRYVVQSDGQDEQCVLGAVAVSRLEQFGGEVGEQAIHGHQKEDAQGGAAGGGSQPADPVPGLPQWPGSAETTCWRRSSPRRQSPA